MKAINRFYKYLAEKSLKPTAIEKEIGLSNGYLSAQKKRGADMGEGMMLKVIDYFRDINPLWLLTGEGPMLRDSKNPEESKLGCTPNATPISGQSDAVTLRLMDKLDEKDNIIKEKESKIDHLNHELAETKAELAVIKAQFSDYKTYSEEKLRQLEAGVPGGKTSAKHVSTKKHSSPNADDATSATAP